ncbi:general L-amino acid transport system substrate-binding protein [Marinobacterium sp. MBR-111]|jgi:general L-amino acid transport system substrate-binding protein|uniref:amino acid ABC transporter substrate-binding protein n=1 Tax=Marinobacterium sp. MBR-111 TaxID=3156463 RepID=UPI0033953557
MPILRRFCCYLIVMAMNVMLLSSVHADTLDEVMRHGDIRCGVFPDDPGRSAIDTDGTWKGFYVDFCRATAAALFGDPERVQYVEVDATTRFTTLQQRQTDVVMYSTTWTLGRENRYQVVFPAVYLFDSQGVMVRANSGISMLSDLQGKTVCVTENTSTHKNLVNALEQQGIDAQVQFSNGDSFFRGHCDAYSADRMNLATNRANRADNPAHYIILSETLSREPIGPMVRNDEARWARVIRSVVNATILADQKGITQSNLDQVLNSTEDQEILNLLGRQDDLASQLGLPNDWARNVIASVGNYSEIYLRHYGPDTAIGMEQGVNKPWSRGGLLFAPLFL